MPRFHLEVPGDVVQVVEGQAAGADQDLVQPGALVSAGQADPRLVDLVQIEQRLNILAGVVRAGEGMRRHGPCYVKIGDSPTRK